MTQDSLLSMGSRPFRYPMFHPAVVALALLILTFLHMPSSHAQGTNPVQLEGQFTYQVEGDQVLLTAADIADTSSTYTTGSLQLQLWLTSSPFAGGTINGYQIATYPLTVNGTGFLNPGESVQVSATEPLTNLPPPGSYYTTLVVAEYTQGCGSSSGYCTDAWGNFPNPFVIGDSNNTSSYGNLVLGNNSYAADFNADTLTFNVSSLSNTSTSYTTGTLRLEWWLTTTPYQGTSIPGNRIATFTIQNSSNGQLAPGQWFQNLQGTVPLTNLPTPGTYYIALLVTEYRQNCGSADGYCVDTYNNFQHQQVVPNPNPPPPPAPSASSSSGGGGGGGGGALGPYSLAALGLLLLLRLIATRRTYESTENRLCFQGLRLLTRRRGQATSHSTTTETVLPKCN